jgi:lactoylglutathione lyase
MKKAFLILVVSLFSIAAFAQKPYASLNHIGLYVTDAGKSAAFYRELFHLDTLKTPWGGNNPKWLSLGNGIALHLIATKKEDVVVSKANHIAFSVPSVDDFVAVLVKNNIGYQDSNGKPQSITLRPDGVKQIYFHDPDGYLIEVNDAKL